MRVAIKLTIDGMDAEVTGDVYLGSTPMTGPDPDAVDDIEIEVGDDLHDYLAELLAEAARKMGEVWDRTK